MSCSSGKKGAAGACGGAAGSLKNQDLGFTIPYTLEGEERNYLPDFIVRVNDAQGADDLLNLVLEVSGEARKDKAAKVATARNLWIPAINNLGGFGRWAFLEISDLWDAAHTIGAFLRSTAPADQLGLALDSQKGGSDEK